jgi:hypothetical protein
MGRVRYSAVVSYQPISLTELAHFIAAEPDFETRWRLVVEFLAASRVFDDPVRG